MKLKFFILLLIATAAQLRCQYQFAEGYYLDSDLSSETSETTDLPTDSSPDAETEDDPKTDSSTETATDPETESETDTGHECGWDLELCTTPSEPDLSYDICMDDTCVSPGSCGDSVACNAAGVYYKIPLDYTTFSSYIHTTGEEHVVIDNTTDLIWQGCPAGQRGQFCDIKEEDVPDELPAKKFTWAEAVDYCENLNWRDIDGWHLPSEYELLTIVNFAVNNPSIDLMSFPGTETLPFWTSSVTASNPKNRWLVDLAYGKLVPIESSLSIYVRCVFRGPGSAVSDRLKRRHSITGQPVVEDAATGLAWQGCPAPSSGADCTTGAPKLYNWNDAIDYCGNLVWGDYSDWYLPDIKVLQSIVDNRSATFTMNSDVFPQIGQEGEYWSATKVAQRTESAWFVNFEDYQLDWSEKTDTFRVRCVRRNLF